MTTISILASLAALLWFVSAGWYLLRRSRQKAKRRFIYAVLAFILSVITVPGNPGEEQQLPPGRGDIPVIVRSTSSPPGMAPGNTASSGSPATPAPAEDQPGQLRVRYLDVGQGDAILVQLPDGQTVLIDAGTNEAGPGVVTKLEQYGVARLDFVIGTHPHEDHIGGLDLVIDSFPVGRIYLPSVNHNTDSYRDLLLAIKNKGLKATEARAGVTLPLGDGVEGLFVSPEEHSYEDLNDYSAVLHLTYGKTAFLFTGDAGAAAESEMLATRRPLKADVLKVAHHGSRSSTGADFLKAVAPAYAVISVGEGNDYGHPHAETLQRLEKDGVKVFRTDRDGSITVIADGQQITVRR